MGLVPLPERSAIDEDDAVLHKSLGSHQLIVRCIVHNIDDPGLAGTA